MGKPPLALLSLGAKQYHIVRQGLARGPFAVEGAGFLDPVGLRNWPHEGRWAQPPQWLRAEGI